MFLFQNLLLNHFFFLRINDYLVCLREKIKKILIFFMDHLFLRTSLFLNGLNHYRRSLDQLLHKDGYGQIDYVSDIEKIPRLNF